MVLMANAISTEELQVKSEQQAVCAVSAHLQAVAELRCMAVEVLLGSESSVVWIMVNLWINFYFLFYTCSLRMA